MQPEELILVRSTIMSLSHVHVRRPRSREVPGVCRPPEEYGSEPTRFDEVRPGTYDIHERIRDMNVNGVLGSAPELR